MSEQREFKWKTSGNVYVDSFFGSDDNDGTAQAPYKTLRKAKDASGTTIVCRGYFSEPMSDGSHSKTICGDYYGAAVFDGNGEHLLYGYSVKNMIILDARCNNTAPSLQGKDFRFRGVGRANGADFVGVVNTAHVVFGVGAPSAFLGKSGLYMGIIGGYTAANMGVSRIVYWKPQVMDDSYRLSLGTPVLNSLSFCTVYDVPLYKIKKSPFTSGTGSIANTILSKTAIILNDTFTKTFQNCVFDAECEFYYFTGANSNSEYALIDLEKAEGDKGAYLNAELNRLYEEKGITNGKQTTFVDCVFSEETSKTLFNDPENMDMTLNVNRADGEPKNPADLDSGYLGALPPSRKIGVVENSDGSPWVWDNSTASGLIKVQDGKIVIDPTNISETGSITSKVIKVNPRKIQFNGIYGIVKPKSHHGFVIGSNELYNKDGKDIFEPYTGDKLVSGIYVVTSESVKIGELSYDRYESIVIPKVKDESNNTMVSQEVDYEGTVVKVIEPNVGDVLYCRCRNEIYRYTDPSEKLKAGVTYLNNTENVINHDNRSIQPGDTYVPMIDGISADGSLAVVFDDETIPSSEWIPARFWGEYYVLKENGVIRHDDYGIPLSTGNVRTPSSGNKSVMDKSYVQFKIMVTRFHSEI